MYKRIVLLLVFASVIVYNVKSAEEFYNEPNFLTQDDSFFLHTVVGGQTVYSLAAMYSVTVDEIYALNPSAKEVIKVGEQLKIPQKSGSFIYHTILPKETLYSVSKKYNMKGEDIVAYNPGLSIATFQTGKTIRIPINRVSAPITGGNETDNRIKTDNLLNKITPMQQVNMMRIALMLPFLTKGNSDLPASSKRMQERMTEYYEGFLLAVREAKNRGISVHLQVYDTGNGTDEIARIVKLPEMKNVNLIIGGVSDAQIKLISRYAREIDVPYIIPFNSQSNEPYNNPKAFQINTPKSNLYYKASAAFVDRYRRDNIIFVLDDARKSNQAEFVETLQSALKEKNISYKTVQNGDSLYSNLRKTVIGTSKNVIVPSSDSTLTLRQIADNLRIIKNSNPNCSISLFGYPSWQVHSEFADDYFFFNTTFYAYFYANPASEEVKSFYDTFQQWYSRSLMNSFPKYGILAYDTGMYFIQLISNYGADFSNRVNDLKFKGIQTDFYFERVNVWGGFINTSLYLVDYKSDYSINKTFIGK